ncbi:DUF3479 domain-containing protein [Methylobacterium oryzae CBMB20]
MPKRITAARPPIRVVIVTLDNHLASAVERARLRLRSEMPGLVLGFHAAAEWETDPATLEACRADIAQRRHRALGHAVHGRACPGDPAGARGRGARPATR